MIEGEERRLDGGRDGNPRLRGGVEKKKREESVGENERMGNGRMRGEREKFVGIERRAKNPL